LIVHVQTDTMKDLNSIRPDWAWEPFEPDARQPWNRRAAAHLYRRAGFGANSHELDEAVKLGVSGSVNHLLQAGSVVPPAEQAGAAGKIQASGGMMSGAVMAGGDPQALGSWWLYRMLYTQDQSLEKLALFWHGHFATSAAKVNDTDMMLTHDALLRRHARGDFGALVRGMAQDPGMLVWLDSTTNRKRSPNENFARELMELFCLGVGNYTEEDIRGLARAFTGREVRRGKFIFNARQHDRGSKTFLGQTGAFGGADAVRIVLEQPATVRFIARKLVRFFICDEPAVSDALIDPLARLFRESDLQVGPIVERIFNSNLFHSPLAIARKVRSPVELGIGVLRSLQATTNVQRLNRKLGQLGQALYYPPNVKGWDGGRAWINSSTLLGRCNLVRQTLTAKETRFHGGSLAAVTQSAGVSGAEDTIDWLLELLVATPPPDSVRQSLVAQAKSGKDNGDQRLLTLVHSISALPEFQLS
jgi:hypothetical protein